MAFFPFLSRFARYPQCSAELPTSRERCIPEIIRSGMRRSENGLAWLSKLLNEVKFTFNLFTHITLHFGRRIPCGWLSSVHHNATSDARVTMHHHQTSLIYRVRECKVLQLWCYSDISMCFVGLIGFGICVKLTMINWEANFFVNPR
jgi:hypothetical protein